MVSKPRQRFFRRDRLRRELDILSRFRVIRRLLASQSNLRPDHKVPYDLPLAKFHVPRSKRRPANGRAASRKPGRINLGRPRSNGSCHARDASDSGTNGHVWRWLRRSPSRTRAPNLSRHIGSRTSRCHNVTTNCRTIELKFANTTLICPDISLTRRASKVFLFSLPLSEKRSKQIRRTIR